MGRRKLTVREALELSPWDKWLQYGLIPWKMILHLLLVFFITLQVRPSVRPSIQRPPAYQTPTAHQSHQTTTQSQASLVNQRSAAYSRAVGRSFLSLFFPKEQATMDPGYTYYIYTINDTIHHAHRLLDTYFEVREGAEEKDWGLGM